MSKALKSYMGACLCGSVTYELDAIPRGAAFCHCESCRKYSGAVYFPWGTVLIADFRVTSGELSMVSTSDQVLRGFCKECGSTMTYQNDLRPGEIDIALVTLHDESIVTPGVHIWVEDKLPWVSINDGLPQIMKLDDSA